MEEQRQAAQARAAKERKAKEDRLKARPRVDDKKADLVAKAAQAAVKAADGGVVDDAKLMAIGEGAKMMADGGASALTEANARAAAHKALQQLEMILSASDPELKDRLVETRKLLVASETPAAAEHPKPTMAEEHSFLDMAKSKNFKAVKKAIEDNPRIVNTPLGTRCRRRIPRGRRASGRAGLPPPLFCCTLPRFLPSTLPP